jgi:hypothetical protein
MAAVQDLQREHGSSWAAVPAKAKQQMIAQRYRVGALGVGTGKGGLGKGKGEWWKTRWSDAGYEIAFDPRSGPEHFVDDALIAQAMSAANKDFPAPGRVLVLVTGDANENCGRVNFRQLVTNALSHHWFVEVHSWRRSCSSWYKDMRDHSDPAVRAGFRLKYLDDATDVWKAGVG